MAGLVLRALAAAGAVTVFASAADAGVVLDQSSFVTGYLGNAGSTGMIPTGYPVHQTHLQTFTVGATGQLTGLDLKILHESGSGAMQLLVFNNGYLGEGVAAGSYGDILAAITFDSASLPQDPNPGGFDSTDIVTSFDLSSFDVDVTAGQVLSFSVRSAEPYGTINYVNLARTNTDYAGGKDYISSNIGLRYLDYGTADLQFQTFVDVGAVPEPASWAMMICGFGLVGSAMRRRASFVAA